METTGWPDWRQIANKIELGLSFAGRSWRSDAGLKGQAEKPWERRGRLTRHEPQSAQASKHWEPHGRLLPPAGPR